MPCQVVITHPVCLRVYACHLLDFMPQRQQQNIRTPRRTLVHLIVSQDGRCLQNLLLTHKSCQMALLHVLACCQIPSAHEDVPTKTNFHHNLPFRMTFNV